MYQMRQNHKINQKVAHSISRAKNFHKQNLEIYRPQLTTAKDDCYLDSRKTRIREVLSEERFPGFGIVQIKCHSVRPVKLLHICPYLKYVIYKHNITIMNTNTYTSMWTHR